MADRPTPRPAHARRSLRFRLLAATLGGLLLALALAGWLLSGLFRDHVQRQFAATLTAQLDQVTARLEFDPAGQPQIDPQALSDPRWSRPYGGLYWQLDRVGGTPQAAVLRSRSLWDASLDAPGDTLADGEVHVHEVAGPGSARLLLVERTVTRAGTAPSAWRLMVAADLRETTQAVARFDGVLAASLALLGALLCAAALAQVAVGLAPLRALQRALAAVHEGRAARLDGRFPAEVQPLVDDFNRVLDRNAEVVERARSQAGNLAHAIKTPLAAMSQAAARVATGAAAGAAAQTSAAGIAAQTPAAALAALVAEQVGVARRHVDWHLARARAAAAHGLPGARTPVQPAVEGLLRVMAHVHAERGLALACDPIAPGLAFAGERQDLQEMVGNLLDNACKWARHAVRVGASATPAASDAGGGQRANAAGGPPGASSPSGARLRIVVEDDGPGIDPARREAALARGARLDESVPGSGLGLAIVLELAGLYGGRLSLEQAPAGGLRAVLDLPGA
jgi:signal transduction histidine kinase